MKKIFDEILLLSFKNSRLKKKKKKNFVFITVYYIS